MLRTPVRIRFFEEEEERDEVRAIMLAAAPAVPEPRPELDEAVLLAAREMGRRRNGPVMLQRLALLAAASGCALLLIRTSSVSSRVDIARAPQLVVRPAERQAATAAIDPPRVRPAAARARPKPAVRAARRAPRPPRREVDPAASARPARREMAKQVFTPAPAAAAASIDPPGREPATWTPAPGSFALIASRRAAENEPQPGGMARAAWQEEDGSVASVLLMPDPSGGEPRALVVRSRMIEPDETASPDSGRSENLLPNLPEPAESETE